METFPSGPRAHWNGPFNVGSNEGPATPGAHSYGVQILNPRATRTFKATVDLSRPSGGHGNGARRFLPSPPLPPPLLLLPVSTAYRSPPPPPLPPPLLLRRHHHAFDPAIRRLACARRFSEIEALIEPLKKETRASCEPFLAAAGMLDHALFTLDESPPSARASRTGRTAFCLNALLSVLINSHLSSSRRRVAHLSRRLSIASDKVSYGILVKSYCLASDAKDVLLVLEKMERRGRRSRSPTVAGRTSSRQAARYWTAGPRAMVARMTASRAKDRTRV